jgi:outer membrane autotransporter protein
VVQPIARQLALSTLGTLQERIGDTLTLGSSNATSDGADPSAWTRVIGQQVDNRYQAFADPRAKGQLIGMQAGIDLLRASFIPDHRDVAGLYFTYLNGDMDVNGLVTNTTVTGYTLTQTGTLNLDSYSLGGYWTHYGPEGWYLDAVLQGTRYSGTATANFATLGTLLGTSLQTKLPTNGTAFVSSLEAGYPVPLPFGPAFTLEPQAQLIWQHTDFDQANDGVGTVALGSTSGTTGRLGLRGQWTINEESGAVWQPYGRFNIWQDWGGAVDTLFSGAGIGVPLVEHATRLEFGGGLTYKYSTSLSFYAQAGYQIAIAPSDTQRDGIKGDVGLRFSW